MHQCNHQGEINWTNVKDWEGLKINFVYIKATEGATYIDEKYKYNFTEASKNGFLVGSYHYFRTTSSPEEQFKNLYDYATEQSYNALVIDATKGKPIFKKNFESILQIN